MTARLSVLNGAVPRACFVGIGPSLNRRVQAAFRVYANELLALDPTDGSQVPFHHFTLEAFIDAIDVAGDKDTADRLWRRYCDFRRIYDAALSALAPRFSANVAEAAKASNAAFSSDAKASAARQRVKATNSADSISSGPTEAGADA
jgi:hypothetical protein